MRTANIDTREVLVDCQSVWKIFGNKAPAAMQAIRERGLTKTQVLQDFGCVVGVSDTSLQVRRGEIFCIMGLSGSGKSTLIRLLNRLITPSLGKVFVKGKDLSTLRICSQVGRPAAAWSGYNVWDVRRGSTRWGSSSGDPMEDNHNTG